MYAVVKYNNRYVLIQYDFMTDGTSSAISKRFLCILKANTLLNCTCYREIFLYDFYSSFYRP